MKKLIKICVFIFTCSQALAQNVMVFTNTKTDKLIEVKEGQQLSLKYSGYLGQTEYYKNIVSSITDSTVTLGFGPDFLGPFMGGIPDLAAHKVIRTEDILAFRRITTGRQISKTLLVSGLVIGSYFLFYDLYRNEKVSVGEGFLISIGITIGSKLLVEAIFPEKPKYPMKDGWKVNVIHH